MLMCIQWTGPLFGYSHGLTKLIRAALLSWMIELAKGCQCFWIFLIVLLSNKNVLKYYKEQMHYCKFLKLV